MWPSGIKFRLLHVDLCILDTPVWISWIPQLVEWIICINPFNCDAHSWLYPFYQEVPVLVTPAIVWQTLWKVCTVLLRQCGVLSLGAQGPLGAVGLMPVNLRDCPCLVNAHVTSLFPPLLLSCPDSYQTSRTAACEPVLITWNFHHLFCKIHLELIRAEDFLEYGTGNGLSQNHILTLLMEI